MSNRCTAIFTAIKKQIILCRFISLQEAASMATKQLCEGFTDWSFYYPHLHMGELYIANAFTLYTEGNAGQPKLTPLPFYTRTWEIKLIEPLGGGRVDFDYYLSNMVYIDSERTYGDVLIKRGELRQWLRIARQWKYLAQIGKMEKPRRTP
jgi:hypothetical protein